jgi:hypothetical protein
LCCIKQRLKQIRIAAEEEELESYESHVERLAGRLKAIRQIGTKLFRNRPYLIIVLDASMKTQKEKKKNNYYVQESVGLATGFYWQLFTMQDCCIDPYSSPMNFISKILNRPANENPFFDPCGLSCG